MRLQFHARRAAALSAMVFVPAIHAEEKLPAPKLVQQFLGKYCTECHDADVQKGDRNFEAFTLPLKTTSDLIDARDIIDQLTIVDIA